MTGDLLEGNHELLMQLKDAPALKLFQKKDLNRLLHFSKIKHYEPDEKIMEVAIAAFQAMRKAEGEEK